MFFGIFVFNRVLILSIFVLNRVSFLRQEPITLFLDVKQPAPMFYECLKLGIKNRNSVLNRVGKSAIFVSNRVRVEGLRPHLPTQGYIEYPFHPGPRQELNLWPSVYRSDAITTEIRRHRGRMSYTNLVYGPARHKFFVAQWLEHPTDVRKVIGSIPVRDSEFFFVSCSWHVEHFTSHFFTEPQIHRLSLFITW